MSTVLLSLTLPVLTALMHLGKLHAYEKALVLVVAFGPFVVLAAVVYVVRRRDLSEEAGRDAQQPDRSEGPGPAAAGRDVSERR